MSSDTKVAFGLLALINILCFVVVWCPPSQSDFVAFYAAGKIAAHSPRLVYDAALHYQTFHAVAPSASWLSFYHPPHELVLFAPLSLLPLTAAWTVWSLFGIGLASIAARLLRVPWWLPFGFFGAEFCLSRGQDSLLLLFLLALSFYLLESGREEWAGVVLALALFKPQIPLVIALVFLWRKRFAVSFGISAAALGAASLALVGSSGIVQMFSIAHGNEATEFPWKMVSLRGLTYALGLPTLVCVAISAVLVLGLAWWSYRTRPNIRMSFTVAILIGLLVGYHIHAYDLAVLAIPLAIFPVRSRLAISAFFMLAAAPLFYGLTMINAACLFTLPILFLLWLCVSPEPVADTSRAVPGGVSA